MKSAIALIVVLLSLQARAAPSAKGQCMICALLDGARERIEYENKWMARSAEVALDGDSINTTNRFLEELRKWVSSERESFGDLCRLLQTRQAHELSVTTQSVYREAGEPDSDEQLTNNAISARTWGWRVAGPFSGAIYFNLIFMRPSGAAGANEPWKFSRCAWCVSGGSLFPSGCKSLPWSPD